jgi:hypothetical protein
LEFPPPDQEPLLDQTFIERAVVSRKLEAMNLEKKLKTDTDTERARYNQHTRDTLKEDDEDILKNDINELIYSKCSRREKRSYEDCKKHIQITHDQDRLKLSETIIESCTHSTNERIQQVKEQLRTAGYLT